MKRFIKALSEIGRIPMVFFKAGCSIVISALFGILFLCYKDVKAGSVGVELYYAPMLDYILTTFIIFWVGMFLLDLVEREIKKNSRG